MIKIKTPNTPPNPAINTVNMFIGMCMKGSKFTITRKIHPNITCNMIFKINPPNLIITIIPINKIITIIIAVKYAFIKIGNISNNY